MNLFFEEDGSFKAGTVLSQAGNAYQVQLPTGRRTKIKASHSFFEFEQPAPADLVTRAQAMVPELDPAFLWEVAPEGEFTYADLAADYWGGSAGPVEKAALLWALHGNPVYFYRKGRGGYRRAPEDILQKALEALEKKRRLEEQRKAWTAEMVEGTLPDVIRRNAMTLLIRPDKNGIEWKALNDASAETRQTPLRLMLSLGGIASPWRWHVDSFYAMNFPQGRGFPSDLPLPPEADWSQYPLADVRAFSIDDSDTTEVDDAASVVHLEGGRTRVGLPLPPEADWSQYPLADVRAFSIDDSDTTEVDDAASVVHLEGGRTRVGIHIAAPALGILRDDPLDKVARARMSTVYAPGLKTTMLPDPWIKAFSLDEGRAVPCLSLYVTVDDETFSVEKTETRLERVSVTRNLRYDKIDSLVTEEAIQSGTLDVEFADEICWLWRFAKKLQKDREEVRGRPEPVGRVDWFFALEGEGEDALIRVKGRRRGAPLDLLVAELMIFANSTWGLWMEEHGTPGIYRSQRMGRVRVKGRRRGAPLDLLVAELMIFANSTWGLWMEEHGTPGIYRSQRMGRVRMSTTPGPHDGLGVVRYAWSTSPLRRYVDLINQRQMITAVLGEPPAYQGNDVELFTIVSQFENIYTLYGDFQTRMERYWSLRWIMQESVGQIEAIVVKGDLVRIDGLPFMQRVPGLPEDLPRGRKVLLQIMGCDLVDLVMDSRLLRVLDETADTSDEDEDEEAALEEQAAVEGGEEAQGGDTVSESSAS